MAKVSKKLISPYLCALFTAVLHNKKKKTGFHRFRKLQHMDFKLIKKDNKSNARVGLITTAHGIIETPAFMPVGTAGTIKAIHIKDVRDDALAQIILGNTYHLYLRPGLDILNQAGGLHQFN